jgi:hypothetical protein
MEPTNIDIYEPLYGVREWKPNTSLQCKVRQNTGTNEQPASQVYSVKVATPEGADPHPLPFLYAREGR